MQNLIIVKEKLSLMKLLSKDIQNLAQPIIKLLLNLDIMMGIFIFQAQGIIFLERSC
jgi:hypothetical protein